MSIRLLLALSIAALAPAQTYEIVPRAGDHFLFEVLKTGFMSGRKHQFVFERYQGTLRYDASAPEKSVVEFTIEAASIKLTDTWLSEKDFRKVTDTAVEEMLETAKYPRLRYVSTRVTVSPGGGYAVQGDLTIKATTRPVKVEVKIRPSKDGSLALDGKAVVNMRDFGLKPPSLFLGAVGTKPEMFLEFTITSAPRLDSR